MENSPKKKGRQTKLTEELKQRILELAKVCKTDTEICEIVGISRDSLYRYISDNSDFSDSFHQARSDKSLELEKALVWDRRDAAESYINKVLKGEAYKIKRRQVLTRSGDIVTLIDEEMIIPNDALLERVLGQIAQSDPNPQFTFTIGVAQPASDRVEEDDESLKQLMEAEDERV